MQDLCKNGNLEEILKVITDQSKDQILRFVCEYGHLEVVKYLVEKCGADVRSDNDLAVKMASGNGHLELVKYLVEKCGADV